MGNVLLKNFSEYEWHNSVIEDFRIVRRGPGTKDSVAIKVRWNGGGGSILKFDECYKVTCDLNMGVISSDTVVSASCTEADEQLDKIRTIWEKLNVGLDGLKLYNIRTSSAGSEIKVYAKSFRFLEL
jgi:hypothetical protein